MFSTFNSGMEYGFAMTFQRIGAVIRASAEAGGTTAAHRVESQIMEIFTDYW